MGAPAPHHGQKTTGALARLTVHLVGRHETAVRTAGPDEVLLTVPRAVILIKNPDTARVWWQGWCAAAALANRVYHSCRPTRPYEPPTVVRSWVELTGTAGPATIDARTPQASTTGASALTIRVANLAVSCGDRDAFGHQLAAWALAYTHAAALWQLPNAQQIADEVAAERRGRTGHLAVPAGMRQPR